ncbi:hypothetical protein LTR27_007158 [Elasticomyces elasticus]|nr:hypothetical protein LTR27_007158 [Elasticomyces elasticus]
MASKRKSSGGDGNQGQTKRFKSNYLDTITILADSSETPFVAHIDALCNHSGFFRAACSKNWESGKQGCVRLPTIEPETIKSYIHWVYAAQVNIDSVSTAHLPEPTSSVHYTSTTLDLFKLYVAADMFLDVPLKNAVMDELLKRMGKEEFRLVPSSVKYVWESTSETSCLRRLLVDTVAACSSSRGLRDRAEWPQEFLLDVCAFFLDQKKSTAALAAMDPLSKAHCAYHEHTEEVGECA